MGKSVSDGKKLVANAITAKGVTTATDASFATMAANIGAIKTDINFIMVIQVAYYYNCPMVATGTVYKNITVTRKNGNITFSGLDTIWGYQTTKGRDGAWEGTKITGISLVSFTVT